MTRKKSNLASRLNSRIIIQQAVLTADDAGGYTQDWEDFAEVWADIMPQRVNETLVSEKLAAVNKIILVTRYLAGVDAGMRIIYEGRIFNIMAVINPYEENILLEIMAQEVV